MIIYVSARRSLTTSSCRLTSSTLVALVAVLGLVLVVFALPAGADPPFVEVFAELPLDGHARWGGM